MLSETLESMDHLNGSKVERCSKLFHPIQSCCVLQMKIWSCWPGSWKNKKNWGKKSSGVHQVSNVKESRFVAVLQPTAFQSIWFYVWLIFVVIEVLLFHRFFSTLTNFAVHPLTQVAPYLWLPVYKLDGCLIGWFRKIFNWKIGVSPFSSI